jgi:ATP-dependent DNA helicase RecG
MLDDPISLHGGPGPRLAYLPHPDPDALATAAVALANTDGGAVVIGLDDGGTYTGPIDGAEVEHALRLAADRCAPAIVFGRPVALETPHGPAVAVRVPRSTRVHALYDGQVLVRSAFGNRVLAGDEIRALLTQRTNGDFDAEIVPGARASDLDPELLAEFVMARARRVGRPGGEIPLVEIGAVTPDYRVTVAGMLLFGRDPQRWLPHSKVRFARFVGQKAPGENGASPACERALGGAAVRLIEGLWDLIQEQMRSHPPASNPREMDYPTDAVREALVNAICHRDYRLRGDSIGVRLFANRLEIASPGGLPGFMTTAQHLVTHRYCRNPLLSRALWQWGYGDGTGQGLRRLFDRMSEYSHRPVEIDVQPYRITVRLYNACETCGEDDPASRMAAAGLNERQRLALAYAREHGSLTVHEFRTLCTDVSPDVLQRDLSDLVQRGALRRIGSRASAYYILP